MIHLCYHLWIIYLHFEYDENDLIIGLAVNSLIMGKDLLMGSELLMGSDLLC
jgi:hypothetical protein